MVSNVSRAICYIESHNEQCFSHDLFKGSEWWGSRASGKNNNLFSWQGNDYQLSCNAGHCKLFQVVPKQETVGDSLVQALFGILTLGLASCESRRDTTLEDVVSFKDGGNETVIDTQKPMNNFFVKPLPMCLLGNINAEYYSEKGVNPGQVSTCIYLNGVIDQDYNKIHIDTFSNLIGFLFSQVGKWIYFNLSGNNQLPDGLFGDLAVNVVKGGSGSLFSSEVNVFQDSLVLIYRYKGISFQYRAPCPTTSCNLP